MRVWGVIPAAGAGTRIQPLAFSKELLPLGSRTDAHGVERPRAVSEHLIDRMVAGGADRLCFVIGSAKADILQYFGGSVAGLPISYVVQDAPDGLCDAVFCAAPLVAADDVMLIGLPDTVWFPADGFARLSAPLSLLLFPVADATRFDAVVADEAGRVSAIEVKAPAPSSRWVWGAMRIDGAVFHALHRLWNTRARADVYLGTLINAWIADGGDVRCVRAGTRYVDVGTIEGYREAMAMLRVDA